MVCLIFHTASIINRKNWKITIKLNFENISICFKKSERTHMVGPPPPPCSFLFAFQWPPPSSQRTYFLKDPLQVFICVWPSLYIEALEINKFSKYSGNLIKSIMVIIFRRVAWNYLKLYLQLFLISLRIPSFRSNWFGLIFSKYLNFKNISKKCVCVPGLLCSKGFKRWN